MASREMIEIILKAEDQASQVIKKNEQSLKSLGNSAKQASDKAQQSSEKVKTSLQQQGAEMEKIVDDYMRVGTEGKSSFDKLTKSQQQAVVKFHQLNNEAQICLISAREVGDSFGSIGKGFALNQFKEINNDTRTWAGSLEYSKAKLQMLGTNTDSLKGKIQVVGNSITTYLGTKWDGLKSKVSSFGNFIKTNLTSALSAVRSKIDSLGSAFSGLGGVISSAIGGLGMASISDLTVGLSLSREKMSSLNTAIMGSKSASDQLLNSIDRATNESVVSMDQMVGAMNKIKLSTQMSNAELANTQDVVMKLGEASMLMGNDTQTAAYQMGEAFSGLNGDFQILKENFGITKEKMEAMGWSGSADDVEGYTTALGKCLEGLGDLGGVMDTNSGKIAQVEKKFRTAGRTLGDMLTPYLGMAADAFLKLEDAFPGVSQGLIVIAGGISGFATLAPSISPILSAFDSLSGKTKTALQFLGLMKDEEGALTLATVRASAAQKIAALTTYASGVANATYTAITGVLAGEIGIAAAAQSIWNKVMMANPVMLVVVALAALALAVYEAGKAFGWWKDVGTMLDAIKTGVMRLWNAFINNPKVQAVIKGIGDAWNWVVETTKPAVDWLSGIWTQIFPESATGQWDVTRAIIEGIGIAFNLLTLPIQNVIAILQLLYPYFLQIYQTALVPLGEFLVSVFTPAWQFMQSIFMQIWPSLILIINAFQAFANGQISLPALIRMVMTNLWNIYNLVFTNIINAVMSWASRMVSRGISAARQFVGGVVGFISSLPGRIASYLYQVVNRIISAGISWVSNGVSAASKMVSGVINNVNQLPGKVYTEFMNIGSRIMDAGGQLVQKAKQIGENIVNGLLNAMGIHSPGIIQEKVVLEFVNMIGRVGSKVKSAYTTASELGSAIVDGFGNPTLETDVSNMLPNVDAVKTQIGVQSELAHPTENIQSNMDNSMVNTSNSEVAGSFNGLANQTGTALQSMVEADRLAYETIRQNDTTQLNAITSNLSSNMTKMTNNVHSSMNNIVSKNKSGMTTVKNTTKTQLDSMVTKTKQANTKMIESWKVMKNGIVSAADKIKTDSTTHFNKLEKTIGGFYRKLQNPSGFGAGPGNGTISRGRGLRRNSNNGFKNIANAVRKAQMPQYLSMGEIRTNPFISSENLGGYITKTGRTNKFATSDLIRSGNIKIPVGFEDPRNKGAGSWTRGVGNHVKKIKDTSNEWSMKGPKIIGKYQTSPSFKVKEFLNGTPNITFDTFRQMAEDVFSQCHYEFYYDSEKYGSWMAAFQNGGMNCSDSTDALIAMARACGLSATKVHGHWNQYGHYWATVNGHKMDTTGWMNRRTWTPAASHAGPAPKSFGFSDLIQLLKELVDDPTTIPENVIETGNGNGVVEVKGTITHEFVNLPDGVSAEEVARLVNDAPSDDNWVKSLIKNVTFQKLDLKEKSRISAKDRRARGV